MLGLTIRDNLIFRTSLAVFLLGVAGCSGREETWGVYFSGLPDKISVSKADEDAVYYILKQTHEPLFRYDDGENYSSRILNSWRRNLLSSEYEFCPDTEKRFNDSVPFTAEFLKAHLDSVSRVYDRGAKVSLLDDCVKVEFPRPRWGFLEVLTRYENAPTINQDAAAELGLGSFYVDRLEEKQIFLKRKKRIQGGYNRINMYEFGGVVRSQENDVEIADVNRVRHGELPERLREKYSSFESIPLKTAVLVFTSPDEKVRKLLYNCVDIDVFRRAAFPKVEKFQDIRTILPMGVPGSQPGRPPQDCASAIKSLRIGRELVIGELAGKEDAGLDKFANEFLSKTGTKLRVDRYSATELVKRLFSSPHPFDMVAIGVSVVQPEYDIFFKDILERGGLVDYRLPELEVMGKRMKETGDHEERALLAAQLANAFMEKSVALPLYQEVITFYYPSRIKNLMVGRGFTEYPEVAEFRW